MITITRSVGRGGSAKRGSDVRKIQELLNKADAKPKLVPDGSIGTKTIRAIEQFQSGFMKKPDGRIDPRGNSLRRLNAKAGATANAAATQLPFVVSFSGLPGDYHFRKFDDPSRGYRGGGGRKAVLRDGNGLPNTRSLVNWYESAVIKGGFHRGIDITVQQWNSDGSSVICEVDFFNSLPVSLTSFGQRIKELTFSFSTYRKHSMY